MNFDVAIIGGGPAGYTAAEKAAANGLNTVLFEKKAIGGVCLNEGCIPTKTLLYSAKVLDSVKTAQKYGIQVEGTPTYDMGKIIARKNKTVKKLCAGVKMKLTSKGVTIINGAASIIGESGEGIQIACGEEIYTTKYLILCTGSETVIPPITGLSDADYWTSKEALESKEVPASLLIIGGGVIGMEFASFYNSMGVRVIVVEMQSEILGTMDKETTEMLRADYTKKGIEFHLSTRVTEVKDKCVIVEKEEETFQIEAEKILVCIGRKPVTENIGIESLNIEKWGRGIQVGENMRTSHPNVYACGDMTGFSLLAHTAIREAEVAVNHILGKSDKMDYRTVPGIVYTNPEIAGVGMTEEELQEKGITHRVMKLPMSFSGRFVAENEMANGLCKLIVNKQNKIIGCHILGNPASELIVIAGIAIKNGYTPEEFGKNIFPHPTVGEIFHEVLHA